MTIQPGEPKRQRLAIKMATGSGKTMAMSLCIVWSYFHALYEPDSPMTTSFLVVAPNVIVFERLKTDFGDAATFRRDPLVPPEWSHDFDLTVLLQDDPAPVTSSRCPLSHEHPPSLRAVGSRGKSKTAPNPVEAMVGPRVNRDVDASSAEELFDRIAERQRVMVVNDEAHHVHDEKLKWNQTIERLHDELRRRTPDDAGAGVVSQLDYSATPKYEKGGVFRHVVVDYPLAQAVADGIVKTPVIGEVSGAKVELGDTTFQRNRQWLDVAVGRWRVFHETLSPSGKRPVLFVMCENTLAADEAGDYLRRLPGLRRRPAPGHPHQPLGRHHQGRPRPRPPCRARGRRARQPHPLHRQRADAPRGLGRTKRLRDRHAPSAQRGQQDPSRAGARPRPAADDAARLGLRRARGRDRARGVPQPLEHRSSTAD